LTGLQAKRRTEENDVTNRKSANSHREDGLFESTDNTANDREQNNGGTKNIDVIGVFPVDWENRTQKDNIAFRQEYSIECQWREF